jgi:Protein of unknown function (DUF2004)
MANYTLPYFGQIDTDQLEEYLDVDIDFKGNQVQIDLNFEGNKIETERLDAVKAFIDNLEKFDTQNKTYISQDFDDEECDTVKTYLEHHLEEIDKNELSELIDPSDKTKEPIKQLLEKLHLVRVGLYPDNEDEFAIFDYSIGQEITQYLVVINTNEKGELDYMTMES